MIYTSGSTGKPKGVMVPHRAVVNFLASMAGQPGLDEGDRLVAVTTLSFDIAVLELLLPLSVGAQVVLASAEQAADGFALPGLAGEKRGNRDAGDAWHMAAPGRGRLGRVETSSSALVGGETLPLALAQQLVRAQRRAVEHVWADRDDRMVDVLAGGAAGGRNLDRSADRQHESLGTGPSRAVVPYRRGRRDLHLRRRRRAGVS